jgi:hypothetical protein
MMIDMVRLRCPKCQKERDVVKEQSDPPGTAVVQVACDGCNQGDFEDVMYFRADGSQILQA